ncbi:hypothetical protein BHE74_00026763 [Ensete ventricosum]|nr:hypothetical protein GW17_00049735 [Ensete ventricosum]RWW65906.1 hypothetical protein BHE74_00026763 [Ensete ventricosum]
MSCAICSSRFPWELGAGTAFTLIFSSPATKRHEERSPKPRFLRSLPDPNPSLSIVQIFPSKARDGGRGRKN